MARRRRIFWLLGLSVALGLAGACSLNPQPIPPGETGYDAAAPTNGKNADAGGGGGGFDGSEAGIGSGVDGGEDASSGDDAGDAGEDAGDASDDAGDGG